MKLYEVHCSADFWIEIEAHTEDEAKEQAVDTLVERGIYDLTVVSSPVRVEDIKEV